MAKEKLRFHSSRQHGPILSVITPAISIEEGRNSPRVQRWAHFFPVADDQRTGYLSFTSSSGV
jgi:hypothetical protein